MSGIELLARVSKLSFHTVQLLLTGYWDLAAVVASVRDCEVYRFMNKP